MRAGQWHLAPELHKSQTKWGHVIYLLLRQLKGTISFLGFTHGAKENEETAGLGSHMEAALTPAG